MDNNDYVEIKDDIDIDAEAEDSFVVCDECTKFVLSQKELRLHKRRYGEVIVCPDCAEETVDTEGYRVHMRKHEAKVQCPGCNKLLLPRSMTRHAKTCRPPAQEPKHEKSNICDRCGKQLSSKQKLSVRRG